jgi:hypothetical protein
MKTPTKPTAPRMPRAKTSLLARIADEHARCADYYRNATSDPHNINTALMVMHSDTAAIYRKLAK